MKCHEQIKLMHDYLDGDLTVDHEKVLRTHLEHCKQCQSHFHELSRTVTLIQSTEQIKAPANFSAKVMDNLPKEKNHMRYRRWFRNHPLLTTAAIIFLFLMGSLLSGWTQNNELVVSKQEDIIVTGDMVVVPEDVTITGDLYVKNGNLKIEGTVQGDVTLVNGHLMNNDDLMASTDHVTGNLKHIDHVFKWIWYEVTGLFESVFSFDW